MEINNKILRSGGYFIVEKKNFNEQFKEEQIILSKVNNRQQEYDEKQKENS